MNNTTDNTFQQTLLELLESININPQFIGDIFSDIKVFVFHRAIVSLFKRNRLHTLLYSFTDIPVLNICSIPKFCCIIRVKIITCNCFWMKQYFKINNPITNTIAPVIPIAVHSQKIPKIDKAVCKCGYRCMK